MNYSKEKKPALYINKKENIQKVKKKDNLQTKALKSLMNK
jgi:hypothetical protein